MDPVQLAQLLTSVQLIAQNNTTLMTTLQNNATTANAGAGVATTPQTNNNSQDAAANVALTSIQVPLDMGENAEEQLVNYHEWIKEVNDKMKVANVTDTKRQTTIALMWGGKDVKEFAEEKADVILEDDDSGNEPIVADTWEEAAKKIKTAMEEEINESFATFESTMNMISSKSYRECLQMNFFSRTPMSAPFSSSLTIEINLIGAILHLANARLHLNSPVFNCHRT